MEAYAHLRSYLKIAIENQAYNSLVQVYESCPETGKKDIALTFLTNKLPYWNMVSLETMATSYFFEQNYSYALVFAEQGFECCAHLIRMGELVAHPDIVQYMGNMARYQLGCYKLTGQNKKGLDLYDTLQQHWAPIINNQHFGGFRLHYVEMLLAENRMDEAFAAMDKIVAEEQAAGDGSGKFMISWQIEYDRLRTKVEALKSRFVELKPASGQMEHADLTAEVNALLQNFAGIFPKQTAAEINKVFGEFSQGPTDDLAKINENYDLFTSILEGFSGKKLAEDSLEKIKSRIHKLGAMLQHPVNGHDPESLNNGVLQVDELLSLLNNRDKEDVMNLLWIKAVCLKRLSLPDAAYRTLYTLRTLLEEKRQAISDIEQRAGVFKSFNWFYHVSAEVAYASGQYVELLNVVEAAKGRSLSDKVALQKKTPEAYTSFNLPFDAIIRFLKQEHAHYLSFFVDKDWSFAVLLTNDGHVMAQKVGIGEDGLNTNDDSLDPKSWRSGNMGLFSRRVSPPDTLAPFVHILAQAEAEGRINAGDHICYCPDGSLHLYPLHYIRYGDGYLIERFSVSKVHDIHQLLSLPDQQSYASCSCLVAPKADDEDEIKTSFNAIAEWFTQHLPPDLRVDTETASKEAAAKALQEHAIVHFSTHGFFPQFGKANEQADNPYYNSGLLISHGGLLPQQGGEMDYRQSPFLLSPMRLTKELDVAHQPGHVSLQACVSGRSKEGFGGDALGMEWALFYLGRTSVLSASWNVDIDYANAFFSHFYHYWLVNNQSKAKAHQLAILKVMQGPLPQGIPAPYYWAAFSLSGDWR